MKWTTLRLNMLPITAVEVEYACQTLTNIHNALVDSKNKQTLIQAERWNIKPLFTANQAFLSQTQSQASSKSSSLAQTKRQPLQSSQQQPLITYQTLFQQYQRLKQQIHIQVNQLKKFYMKNSQDESSSLFHMLRLKLQRCLFDCNFQQDQTKKVMTKAQEEMKYHQIAKNFQSNQSKTQLKSIVETDQEFVQSCQTFKTQNYTGYQNQSNQTTKHHFLNFQDQQIEELFHDDKVKNKKQPSKSTLNSSLEKKKNSASNTKRSSKQATRKLSSSKILLQKQPNSQVTIATLNQRQLSSDRINLDTIQNEQKSSKNLKILTNKNPSFKNTIKTSQNSSGFLKQGQMKQNPMTQSLHPLNQKNKNQKMKSYAGLNQKKEEHNKIYSNILQKQKLMSGNQVNKSIEVPKNSFKKSQAIVSTKNPTQKVSNTNKTILESSKKDLTINTIPQSPQEQTLNTIDQTDLKDILTSKGSELRFTIKMSREQYKSLLQLKSKMLANHQVD